jgi:lactoylglutathione lyase
MKYLHTMVRVSDLDKSLHFYRDLLGLVELRRIDNEGGRFTLVFLAAPGDESAQVELTWNWTPRTTLAAATLVTWPTRWMTSMPPAST